MTIDSPRYSEDHPKKIPSMDEQTDSCDCEMLLKQNTKVTMDDN